MHFYGPTATVLKTSPKHDKLFIRFPSKIFETFLTYMSPPKSM